MILEDMVSNPGEIKTECHKNYEFEDRYPGMTPRDWDKVVMNFIHDVQSYYDLELPEIFSMTA